MKDKAYYELLYKFGLCQSTLLNEEEIKKYLATPPKDSNEPNIIFSRDRYHNIEELSSQDEFQRIFMLKALSFLCSIKKGITFFTVLAIIGVAAAIIVPLL